MIESREELDHVGFKLAELRSQKKVLEEEIKSLQAEVLDWLDRHEQESVTSDRVIVNKVAPTKLVVDERMLKKKLGARRWRFVTKRVLDEDLLEMAIAEGEVDPVVVSQCSHEVPRSRPYVRVKVKKEKR